MRPRSRLCGRWPQLLRGRPDGARATILRDHRPPGACAGLYHLGPSAARCGGCRVLSPGGQFHRFQEEIGNMFDGRVRGEHGASPRLTAGWSRLRAAARGEGACGVDHRGKTPRPGLRPPTNTARAVPAAPSAPTSTPSASGGVTET